MGVITSLGEGADEMWDNICAGKSGIKMVTRFDFSTYPVKFGGECTNFDVTKYGVEVKEARRIDRFGHFGMAASVSAAKDSGLDLDKTDRYRVGVIIGSGIGGIETLEEQNKILNARGVSARWWWTDRSSSGPSCSWPSPTITASWTAARRCASWSP